MKQRQRQLRYPKVLFILFCAALQLMAFAHDGLARKYEGFGPINSRIQNPVYLQNLSLIARTAEVLPTGVLQARIDSAYSNLFEQGQNPNAKLDLDMEFWRLAVNADFGIARGMEMGVEIPLVHFGGGFLDSFIQHFHHAFGFPNAGREQRRNGEYHYQFDANGKRVFNYPSTVVGLGDITLRFKHQLTGEDDDWPALAWFADLKFPTGRASRGFGNGSLDLGLGLALDVSWKRLHGYTNVGYYVTGGNSQFSDFMRNEMFAYMVAGELTLLDDLSLIVQLEGSTPLLTGTGIDEWDGVPVDLVVGFRGEERNMFGEWGDLIWQVGFAEDVTSIGPSVDFTVYMSLGFRFDLFGRKRPVGDWIARK